MAKRPRIKPLRWMVTACLGVLCVLPQVEHHSGHFDEISLPPGERTVLPIGFPAYARTVTSDADVIAVQPNAPYAPGSPQVTLVTHSLGQAIVSTKLWGIIPWKSVHVHVVAQEWVVPGGQCIGVRLHSNGIAVMGIQSPPRGIALSGVTRLKIGDVIERVDGNPIRSTNELRRVVGQSDAIHLQIRRGGGRFEITVKPWQNPDGTRHLGLYVRDRTAGVGTLTFYDPDHHRFGALGHMVTDADTGRPVQGDGTLHPAWVTGIVKGTYGQPGEKRGRFISGASQIGVVEENSQFGVFGEMPKEPSYSFSSAKIPVALPDEVLEGPAKLLTVLDGTHVEAFDVRVDHVTKQGSPDTKSMIIRVVDQRLLRRAGGIVQGMSGSPLIQNGRLIGAVTHVFVSDPTRGYGVYAEWMVEEAEHGIRTSLQLDDDRWLV